MLASVASASRARAHDAVQIALEQRDAGALDRDVGARAHGDADVGGGERRRVVDAVAGHGDLAALRLQLGDEARLVLRQHVGVHRRSMPSSPRDGLARWRGCRPSP